MLHELSEYAGRQIEGAFNADDQSVLVISTCYSNINHASLAKVQSLVE